MERKSISTENIICSLFDNGFDQVDDILYVLVEGKIASEGKYCVVDKPFSSVFYNYVGYDGYNYKIRNGKTLDSNVLNDQHGYYPVRGALNVSEELSVYLSKVVDDELIRHKISELGINGVKDYKSALSTKEKLMVADMFGITSETIDKGRQYKKA